MNPDCLGLWDSGVGSFVVVETDSSQWSRGWTVSHDPTLPTRFRRRSRGKKGERSERVPTRPSGETWSGEGPGVVEGEGRVRDKGRSR